MVLKGFNTEIYHNGNPYHVQTEDWGNIKRSIVTKVFKNGAVVRSIVMDYDDIANCLQLKPEQVAKAMKNQHDKVLSSISNTTGQTI